MKNLKVVLFTTLLISGLVSNEYTLAFVFAIPSDLLNHKYVFGILVGVTENDTGSVDGVLSGIWRSVLANDTGEAIT
jgi:hypothetical protein